MEEWVREGRWKNGRERVDGRMGEREGRWKDGREEG